MPHANELTRLGLTWRPQPLSESVSFEAMREALARGANFWNGGEFYGPPENNSLTLLNKYFEKYPEDADKVVLSIKGGLDKQMHPRGDEASLRRSVDNCIKMLGGRKKIDIFEAARVDPNVPIEETVKALNKMIEEGKFGAFALSEASAETIKRAAKVGKVAAVETEVSLFEDNAFQAGIAQACAEHNIPIVAYSPLGRGFLTGGVKTPDDLSGMQKRFPRFQGENFNKNLELVDKVKKHAEAEGATAAQYSIAWVASRSNLPGMPLFIPIPGASSKERVAENMEVKQIPHAKFKNIDEFLKTFTTAGTRYPEQVMAQLNG